MAKLEKQLQHKLDIVLEEWKDLTKIADEWENTYVSLNLCYFF